MSVLCPRCAERSYTPYGEDWDPLTDPPPPALSRMDNETYICSECGQDEAMRDMFKHPPIPPNEWPISRKGFGMGIR